MGLIGPHPALSPEIGGEGSGEGAHRSTWVKTKGEGSGRDDSMGLFSACVEGLLPLAAPGRNLIAPSEKTSPRPPHNGWVPWYSKMKPMIWATAPITLTLVLVFVFIRISCSELRKARVNLKLYSITILTKNVKK
jgi:hypothetical protein